MAEINLRIGVTKNIKGYSEETKVFDMPILDANNQPVVLTGSTITFKTKQGTALITHDGLIAVSPDSSTALRWTLTGFPRMERNYEVKIVRTDNTVIIIDGLLTIQDNI